MTFRINNSWVSRISVGDLVAWNGVRTGAYYEGIVTSLSEQVGRAGAEDLLPLGSDAKDLRATDSVPVPIAILNSPEERE